MLIAVLIGLLLAAGQASAQFYTDADLEGARTRSAPILRSVLRDDIIGNLPRELRPGAALIELDFPREGSSLLDFHADPQTAMITMPLESIRFFDDLATLTAWIESRDCPPEAMQAYLWALLRQGQPMPSPLRAFAIDRAVALADPFTNDVSDKIFSSGLLFILAHEVGHLMLGHQGGLAGQASQAQEIAADDFAMDHFARIGAMPLGVVYYFLAAWWQDPVDADHVAASTHPVSPGRIAAVAARMQADPMSFAFSEPDAEAGAARVLAIAGYLQTVADLASDTGMLTLLPEGLERDFPATRLAGACPT